MYIHFLDYRKIFNKYFKMLLKTLNTDVDKICRLCLYQGFETEIMSICKIPDLVNKIKECVSLDVELNEKFPSMVCLACLQQLNQWTAFKEVCHQSHNILLQSVASIEAQDQKPPKPEQVDIKEQCHDNSDLEDNSYEPFDPDVDIGSPKEEISSDSSEDIPKKRKVGRPKKRKTQTRLKLKRKATIYKSKIKKVRIKTKKEPIFESETEDEPLEDTVEALEKYLYKLCQEDAEKALKKEISQVFTYTCEICSATFSCMFDYLDHQETHNGQPLFRCHRCEQVFTSRSELVDHDNRHQVPCPKCGKMILPGCLKTHMVLHTDKYKCSQCNWRFCNSTMLRQHVESVHIRLKTHVCERCGKSFTSTTSLQTHIKIHSEVRPYNCKICDYSGRTASALYTHMARHENGLHVCEICAKSFKSFRSLRDHTRRVHSEKKKHECGFCQKKFVDKYMLTVHTRTHTGARPYACTLCDRAFVRSDGLREHLATHGQRASYNCQQCGKKFIYRRSLGRHTCSAVTVIL